ncbi:MAG: hypothetical protein JWP88_776, partial [Flaviaesturariibacter sp.]|nr:hypothetical protein [Flaviaesturariibacter sp.]
NANAFSPLSLILLISELGLYFKENRDFTMFINDEMRTYNLQNGRKNTHTGNGAVSQHNKRQFPLKKRHSSQESLLSSK